VIVQRPIVAPVELPEVAPDPDEVEVGLRHEVTQLLFAFPAPLALTSWQAATLWSAPLPDELYEPASLYSIDSETKICPSTSKCFPICPAAVDASAS
jgi:hypothetical protein